ncbi:hypothetical protein O4H49_16045 [Kiloniella laminariae]|uniref:Uncharacterized protein n=1 Tax=Kiloniella laminariae TaxID=454162 RepID=A0ABT4LMK0_9PROT|nr:hypothetical protein [Kiloniella laminariae]MCZ4282299.1 hypothetical protein [Kiloniella laminariae]
MIILLALGRIPGLRIDRTWIPMTLISMSLAVTWLWLGGWMAF